MAFRQSQLAGFVLVLMLLVPAQVLAQDEVPADRYVTDLTGTLTDTQIHHLTEELASFEEDTGSQVVVAIVPTTGQIPIEDYSLSIAERLRIGRENIDDGVLLLIAKEDRRLRIEVGYGLEGAIPDARAKQIIDYSITPNFRSGGFYDGILNGLNEIFSAIRTEQLPTPAEVEEEPKAFWEEYTFALGLDFHIFSYLSAQRLIYLGLIAICCYPAFRHGTRIGFIVAIVTYFVSSLLHSLGTTFYFDIPGLIIGPILFALIAFGIFKVLNMKVPAGSGSYSSSSRSSGRSWYSSSSSSFGSSSSSSFSSSSSSSFSSSSSSSFSGGGGSFGGGGASGSW